MQERGNQNEPYEPAPYEEPQDATPPEYAQRPYPPQYPPQYPPAYPPQYPPQGYTQQPYGAPPQGYYPPPPVQVNVVQNNGHPPVAVRKRLNHALHITLSFFTGGAWLLVYVPLLMKRRKIVYYR
jgi:hypothetical protein